jgi:FAD binding domain
MPRRKATVGLPGWKRRINSHESFTHDSIDSLGYDWSRVADPSVAPKIPFKVYLPRTTDDIVRAVREAKSLGERLAIRSKGHSSNDLVLTDGGSLLLTEKLNQVVEVDEETMTATVQSGAVSAEVDDLLAAWDCRSSATTTTSPSEASPPSGGSARPRTGSGSSSILSRASSTSTGMAT